MKSTKHQTPEKRISALVLECWILELFLPTLSRLAALKLLSEGESHRLLMPAVFAQQFHHVLVLHARCHM
jgi:hypothetical protein